MFTIAEECLASLGEETSDFMKQPSRIVMIFAC